MIAARREPPSSAPNKQGSRRLWCSAGLWLSCAALSCSRPAPLAKLEQKSGAVERDWAAHLGAWQTAEIGTPFALGDGIQTHAGASAALRLDDGSGLALTEETLIRFSATPPEPHSVGFDVETGEASLHAAAEPVSIHTRVGSARLAPGATVVFSHERDALRIVVEVGQAVFGHGGALLAGSAVEIGPDGDVKNATPPQPPAASETSTSSGAAGATGAPDLVASLISAHVHGRGASVHTERGWAPLAEGTQQLQPGAELLLERKTTVELERGDERARLETNGAYRVAPRQGVLVAATRGAVTAGGPGEVRIDVPGGSIVVPSDGRATVSLGAHGTWLDVQSRDVVVEANGQREQIRPGQRASIGGDGGLSVQGRGLDHADVEVSVGESLVIHDPAPPTAVRFAFANRCHELGVLELSHGTKGEFAVGESAVSLQVPRGVSHYRLSCGADRSQVVQSGTITVLADDGSRKMAARAPVTKIIADGHRYTVLYQNRLPVISLSWPGAPSSDGLRLQHEFGSEKEALLVTGPEYTFPSGKLREGHHEFYFEGGGKVSRHTRVDIQFDNAAPTATLDGPGLLAAAPGQALTVSGIAVPGWDVLVAGQRPSKDAQGRFSAAVTWPADTRALAVRLSQADRGTHVYLRRARQP